MPDHALICFFSLYDGLETLKDVKKSKTDPNDYVYNDTSVLTSLCFRLKHSDNNIFNFKYIIVVINKCD